MATLFILHGHWETTDERGVTIVTASFSENEVIRMLSDIVENKAMNYCKLEGESVTEDCGATMYERVDMDNHGFVGFYITLHDVVIPKTIKDKVY